MKNVVSFSGGKDSAAMLLRMIELNIPIDNIVFADTTLEFPEMYEYINKIEKYIGKEIIRVTAKHTWDEWFYGHWLWGSKVGEVRGFPFVIQQGCWWKRDAKFVPLSKWNKGNINHIGIAKDEEYRSKSKMYEKGIWNFPLIEWGWTEKDCANYLKSRGFPHPLYTKFKRTGC